MSMDEKRLQEAEGYLELELPGPALASLEKISADGERENRFAYHYLAGEAHRQLRQYEEAIPHLIQARAEKPAEITAHINLGWCYKRCDRLADAIETLVDAERICRLAQEDSSLTLVLYNLSCYYSLAGQKEKMLEYLADAIERNPKLRDSVPDEEDFDPYRRDPDLLRLLTVIV